MAIEANVLNSRLQLRFNTGVDDEGNPITKVRSYGNLKSDADDQALYDVAAAIGALQSNTLEEVRKVQDIILVNLD